MVKGNNNNMSMTMGNVSGFNPDEDDWNTYIEQLNLFLKQI